MPNVPAVPTVPTSASVKSVNSVNIYASQVAACIGRHRYKSTADAFEELWRRTLPSSYYDALSRNKVLNEEQHVAELCKKHPCIDSILQVAHVPTCKTSADVSSHVKELTRQAPTLAPDETQRVEDAVKRAIFTTYGTEHESAAIEMVYARFGIRVRLDDSLYRTQIAEIDGIPIHISGRVDGLTEDNKIIEIKNRVRRLFSKAPEYEIIQCQTYMHLVNSNATCLIECLKTNQKDANEMNCIHIERDESIWNQSILPRAKSLGTFLLRVLGDPTLQDAYLSTRQIEWNKNECFATPSDPI